MKHVKTQIKLSIYWVGSPFCNDRLTATKPPLAMSAPSFTAATHKLVSMYSESIPNISPQSSSQNPMAVFHWTQPPNCKDFSSQLTSRFASVGPRRRTASWAAEPRHSISSHRYLIAMCPRKSMSACKFYRCFGDAGIFLCGGCSLMNLPKSWCFWGSNRGLGELLSISLIPPAKIMRVRWLYSMLCTTFWWVNR
jgi:hypothetical protein